MAIPLTTYRPPHAVTMWADDTRIFVELPATSGPAFITTFELTEGGLEKALYILKQRHRETGAKPTKLRQDPRVKTKTSASPGTDEQRAAARAVLKKMGIV